jgi:hypothetical protein
MIYSIYVADAANDAYVGLDLFYALKKVQGEAFDSLLASSIIHITDAPATSSIGSSSSLARRIERETSVSSVTSDATSEISAMWDLEASFSSDTSSSSISLDLDGQPRTSTLNWAAYYAWHEKNTSLEELCVLLSTSSKPLKGSTVM